MLFNIDGKRMTHMPHKDDYDRWRANLSDAHYQAIIDELLRIFDKADEDDKVVRASYIPGSDWNGTVYQPIYHACGEQYDIAKLFFGMLVWEAVQLHGKDWIFIQEEGPSDRPFGKTYFRKK